VEWRQDDETVRVLTRENESALILARHGFDVEQNPRLPCDLGPDYLIEGRAFDNAAPTAGTSARNIAAMVARSCARSRPPAWCSTSWTRT